MKAELISALRKPSTPVIALALTVFGLIVNSIAHHYLTDITDPSDPGFLIGMAGVFVPIIGASVWLRRNGLNWADMGLGMPERPLLLLGQTIIATAVSYVVMNYLVPPVAQWVGHHPDVSHLLPVRGNLPGFLFVITIVWVTAALVEEMFFRGYLIPVFAAHLGNGKLGWILGALVSSAIFGLAHAYQGLSGMVITALTGLSLALMYLAFGRRLWPLILAHGIIDTISIYGLYAS